MITTLYFAVAIAGLVAALFCFLLAYSSNSQGGPPGIYVLAAIICLTLTCLLLAIAPIF